MFVACCSAVWICFGVIWFLCGVDYAWCYFRDVTLSVTCFGHCVSFQTRPPSYARLHVLVLCVCVRKTGCFGVEGLEVAAFLDASGSLLGGIRADGHGLPEPGVLVLLLLLRMEGRCVGAAVAVAVVVVVVLVDGLACVDPGVVAFPAVASDMAAVVLVTAVQVSDHVLFHSYFSALSWIVALRMRRKTPACTADDVQQ